MTVTSQNQTEPTAETTKVREEPPRAKRPIYLRRMNRPLEAPPFGNEAPPSPPPATERPEAPERHAPPKSVAGLNTRTGNHGSIAGMVFVASVIVATLIRMAYANGSLAGIGLRP